MKSIWLRIIHVASLSITIMLEHSAEIPARFDVRSEAGKVTRVTVEVSIPEAARVAISQ